MPGAILKSDTKIAETLNKRPIANGLIILTPYHCQILGVAIGEIHYYGGDERYLRPRTNKCFLATPVQIL